VYQNSDDNLVLTNVTLANNWAGGFGGGLYHYSRYAILTNVTITDNNAGLAGAAIYEDAPMTPGSPGVIQLTSSVIAGSANNCDGPPFQSLGYNISRGTCSALDHPTDRENYSGSLLLGPLAFNGGAFAMNTRLPQAGSPLVNAGNAALCTPLDQRGAPRVGRVRYRRGGVRRVAATGGLSAAAQPDALTSPLIRLPSSAMSSTIPMHATKHLHSS
jgi:hypothetical protein